MAQKSKPSAVRIADGTARGDKMNADEPRPAVGAPEPPPFLTGDALDEWHRLAPVLTRIGLLTTIDGTAFASYCVAHARWIAAERALANTGSLALFTLVRRALADVRRYASEFGIQPTRSLG